MSWDGVARAVLEVVDPVRPGAAEAVRGLRGLGLLPVLLTGDDAGAARGLAAALGVEEVVARGRGRRPRRRRRPPACGRAHRRRARAGRPTRRRCARRMSRSPTAARPRSTAAPARPGVPGGLRSERGGRAAVRGHPPRRRPARPRSTPSGRPAGPCGPWNARSPAPPSTTSSRCRSPPAACCTRSPRRRGGRLSRDRPAARRGAPPNPDDSPAGRGLIAAGHTYLPVRCAPGHRDGRGGGDDRGTGARCPSLTQRTPGPAAGRRARRLRCSGLPRRGHGRHRRARRA